MNDLPIDEIPPNVSYYNDLSLDAGFPSRPKMTVLPSSTCSPVRSVILSLKPSKLNVMLRTTVLTLIPIVPATALMCATLMIHATYPWHPLHSRWTYQGAWLGFTLSPCPSYDGSLSQLYRRDSYFTYLTAYWKIFSHPLHPCSCLFYG